MAEETRCTCHYEKPEFCKVHGPLIGAPVSDLVPQLKGDALHVLTQLAAIAPECTEQRTVLGKATTCFERGEFGRFTCCRGCDARWYAFRAADFIEDLAKRLLPVKKP